MHAVAEVVGHRWGGSPWHRGGMAGGQAMGSRHTKPLEPSHGAGGHGNPSETLRHSCQNPSASLGPASGLLGLLGGAAAGGRPRVPGRRGLTSASARLGPAEEKPQSSHGIFSVNRVFLDPGFKKAQLLSRVLIRKC